MIKKEEIEKAKTEVLKEMNEIEKEIKKTRRKKFLKFILFVVVIASLIKIFFGTIEINNFLYYPPNKVRFYKVTVNDTLISAEYYIRHKIPIIPYLVHFNSYYYGINYVEEYEHGPYFYDDGSKEYLIDIKSYSCYAGNYQIECSNYEPEIMKKNDDTKFTNMKITRTTKPYEEVYNGKFINNITPYIREKGTYTIEITAKFSLVETKVDFYFSR